MTKDRRRQKENNKNDTEQNKKQTNKRRKPVHPIKEMNEKLKYKCN